MKSVNHLSGLSRFISLVQHYFSSTDANCKASKAKRQVIFKRAEAYVKEYQEAEREQIRLNRLAKKEGNFYVPAQPKLVFVVRIKGYRPIHRG